ncbi:MAG: hypothetical protein R3A43_05005 [Bacteroidia bacterium]
MNTIEAQWLNHKMNKNSILLKIIFSLLLMKAADSSCQINQSDKKYTRAIVAIEKCTDSSIIDCWEFYPGVREQGFYLWDTISNSILREQYFVWDFGWSLNKINDSVFYLGKGYNLAKMDEQEMREFQFYVMPQLDSLFRYPIFDTTLCYGEEYSEKIKKKMEKKMKKHFIPAPYYFVSWMDAVQWNICSKVYLFEVTFEYHYVDTMQPLEYLIKRRIPTVQNSKFKFEMVETRVFFINKIVAIKPVALAYSNCQCGNTQKQKGK